MRQFFSSNFFCFAFLIFVLLLVNLEPLYKKAKALTCQQCFSKDDYRILEEEGIKDVAQRTKEMISAGIIKYNHLGDNPVYLDSIPYITHHVYFTASGDPKTIKPIDILNIIKTSFELNKINPKWKHYIWTNQPEIMPKEFEMIPNLEIRNIEEFKNHFLYKELSSLIYATNFSKRYFAASSDIARLMIVEKFGGIYMDLDYEIYEYKTLMQLIRSNNFVSGAIVESVNFYEVNSSFFAAKPGHTIISTALSLSYRNLTSTSLPNYINFPCSKFHSGIVTTMVPLTVGIYKALDIKTDILLPIRFIFNIYKPELPYTAIVSKEIYQLKYQEKPIGNDRFSGSWHQKSYMEDEPCLKNFKNELLELMADNK